MNTLGRYKIVGELGRGAMGAVYRASDPLIERDVAIKTLLPTLPPEVMDEVRERFIREARSAGRLNHPNIVTIFDVGEQDGVAYIAMELLEGRSLQQILREDPRLPFDTVAELVAQVADALDAAQAYKIVHRDVKPANIMVGPTGRAKLTDFGVAHVESSSMTQTGAALGSPKYMSPEQVLGLPVDPRSDIFSLGVVLYEMLVRKTPFERPTDTTVFTMMHRIAGEPHVAASEVDSSVPAGFDAILARALAKKPEQRYQRAGEMSADLRRYKSLAGGPAAPSAASLEKTVVNQPTLQAAPPPPVQQTVARPATPQEQEARDRLMQDLDRFAHNFEEEERARIRAEQEAIARRAAELQRWGETEMAKRAAFERGQEPAGETDPRGATMVRKPSALEALRTQKTAQAPKEDPREVRQRAVAALDAGLRAARQYLEQLAKELNTVHPVSGRSYEFVYLGKIPAVKLEDARIEARPLFVEGRNVVEAVSLRFRATPVEPARASVGGDDILRCKTYLESLQTAFKAQPEARNEAGKITRATFLVTGGLPAEIHVRGDYNASQVLVELVNVRRVGRVQARIPPPLLESVIDDLARYAIGVDDDFERVIKKP
ncbi:MAG: protein kinase domain-containing protein [Clostridia bacterium]